MLMEIALQASALGADIDRALDPSCPRLDQAGHRLQHRTGSSTLPIASRPPGLEQLRDFFDRRDLGLMLIGMPGFDRHWPATPQLYSRIGFAHQYKQLDPGVIQGGRQMLVVGTN